MTRKVMARIHSLDGEQREVTIIDEVRQGNTITYHVELANGIRCTAIYNVFNGDYYADDKYGILKGGGQ